MNKNVKHLVGLFNKENVADIKTELLIYPSEANLRKLIFQTHK